MERFFSSKVILAFFFVTMALIVGVSSTISASAKDYTEQTITVTEDGAVVDSFMGIDAEYVTYPSDTGYYCCASYVSKFYSELFGVTVYNINTIDDKPSVYCWGKKVELKAVKTPQAGDIMQTKDYSHVAIVKDCTDDVITLIEQNYKWTWNKEIYSVINRKVIRGNHYYYRLYIDGVEQSLDMDETPPTISSMTSSSVTSEGFTVSATLKDNKKVTMVKVCSCLEGASESDFMWKTYSNPSKNFTYTLKTADFGSKDSKYIVKIYAYDASGNYTAKSIKTYVDTTPPKITGAKITAVSAKGFTVSCSVSDANKIQKVEVPVWTKSNGYDDKRSYYPVLDNSSVKFNVLTSDHNNESGVYRVKIKVYDEYGNGSSKVCDVTINPAKSVSLSVSSLKLKENAKKTITAKMSGSNLTDYVSWKSEDVNVATVDGGVITAKTVGKTTVVAQTTGGKSAKCEVSVTADISSAEVEELPYQVYYGYQVCPSFNVKYGGKQLVFGTDYTVSYSDCDSAGKATAVIKGTGLFTGKKTVSYIIVPDKVTNLKTTKISATGVTFTWDAVKGAERYYVYLYNTTDKKWYRYKSVKGCSFTDSGLVSGKKYKYRVKAYSIVDGEYYLSSPTSTLNVVTNPRKAVCTVVSKKSGQFTVSWDKLEATGYEVVMSDTGETGTYKKIADTKDLSFTYKKADSTSLKFIRVRGYRIVNGVKQKGVYSNVLMVMVK